MKIVIESPEKLTDSNLEEMLTCGIEKVDGLLCKLSFRLLSRYISILTLLMLAEMELVLRARLKMLAISFQAHVATSSLSEAYIVHRSAIETKFKITHLQYI